MKFRHPSENTISPTATLYVDIGHSGYTHLIDIRAVESLKDCTVDGTLGTRIYMASGNQFETSYSVDQLVEMIGWVDVNHENEE